MPNAKREDKKAPFGKLLNNIRTSRNISLRNLSRRAGISPSYLSKIENNLSPSPSVHIVKKMAACLKISEDDLLIRAGYLPGNLINNDKIQISFKILKILNSLDKKLLQLILDFSLKLTDYIERDHEEK